MGMTAEEQWAKELRRILNARSTETETERTRITSVQVQEKQAHYGKAAIKVAAVKADEFRRAQERINALNRERYEEAKREIELKQKPDRRLVEPKPLALSAEDVERTLSEPTPWDPDLLLKEIARNDSWGNFDLAIATNPKHPDFETHAKVLVNVAERLIKLKKEQQDWEAYSAALGETARAAQLAPAKPVPITLDRSREIDEEALADPTKVYKLAILGAGASAAYYIANSSPDLANTVLIGEKQPWAGERGADGYVNHPHVQIDPENYQDVDPDDGLAKRQAFSDKLKAVIDRMPHQCDGRVAGVEKDVIGDPPKVFWKITTSKGVYFAQTVQSAMGSGEHIQRGNEGEDMDTYKRSIVTVPKSEVNKQFSIGINGGSAAIDVVTDVLRKYSSAAIHWAPGGTGAQFIPGTDNDLSSIPYYEAAIKSRDALPERIRLMELEVQSKERDDELKRLRELGPKLNKEIKDLEKSVEAAKKQVPDWKKLAARVTIYPGRGSLTKNTNPDTLATKPFVLEADGRKIEVDKAIYAVGQDNESLSKLFKDKTKGGAQLDVQPTLDTDRHFTIKLKPEESNPEEIRKQLKLEGLGKVKGWEGKPEEIDLLNDPPVTEEALKALATENVPIGAESDDGSLQFIGAQGFRELEAKSTRANAALGKAKEELAKAEKMDDSAKGKKDLIEAAQKAVTECTLAAQTAADLVKRAAAAVPNSLGPNVANNAQLTSARERVVAAENSLPVSRKGYPLVTEADGVSFITANQTVLAVHIANTYPSIKPALADYLVAQIIVHRSGPKGPVPQRRTEREDDEPEHHLQAVKAFHDEWRKRLKLFEKQSAKG